MKRNRLETKVNFDQNTIKKYKRYRNEQTRKFCLCYMYYLQLLSYQSMHKSIESSANAIKRNPTPQVSWLNYCGNMNAVFFRRRFRMNKEHFDKLVNVIKAHVGEIEFKSESFLERELAATSKSKY